MVHHLNQKIIIIHSSGGIAEIRIIRLLVGRSKQAHNTYHVPLPIEHKSAVCVSTRTNRIELN